MATIRECRELNRHWLRRLLRGEPHLVIGGPANPYLLRWFIIPRNRFMNVYLHKFLRSDDDRALHDHPWWFVSLILRGGYWEHRAGKPITTRSHRTAGSLVIRPANTVHRVELECVGKCKKCVPQCDPGVEIPAWTLVITGPKIRDWGFACPRGWVHWQEFDHNNGCGEYS